MNQSIEGPEDTNASITKVMNTLNTMSPTIKKGFYSMETTEGPVSYPVSNDDLKSVDENIEISSSQGKNIFNISTYRSLSFINITNDCLFSWRSLFPILNIRALGCRSNWDCPRRSHYCKMSRKKGLNSIDDNSRDEISDVGTCTSKGK